MKRLRAVTRVALRRIPLPQPDPKSDKDGRGSVLIVGGSVHVPGAVLLAGVAALRAGAGKLQLASVCDAAIALGTAVPECLVISLPQSRIGEIAGSTAVNRLREYCSSARAVLIGPGISNERAARALTRPLTRKVGADGVLVLDAAATHGMRHEAASLRSLGGRLIMTPHAGEMAALLGVSKSSVEDDPAAVAQEASARFGAVVVLKGAASWIAVPGGALHRYDGGNVGLATSGSGDTLAGIIAGLAARGAPAEVAAVWGVYLHGAAGQRLARRLGPIGFLARELLDEIPSVLRDAARRQ